jgi:hypothetical protein
MKLKGLVNLCYQDAQLPEQTFPLLELNIHRIVDSPKCEIMVNAVCTTRTYAQVTHFETINKEGQKAFIKSIKTGFDNKLAEQL